MNSSEIEQLGLNLLNLRAELLKQEEASGRTDPPSPLDQGIGGLSRREAMHAEQRGQEGCRRRKRQLQKIDGALRRIEAGEYGRCFVCEEDLDTRRLSEDPTVTRCASCAEE